MSRPTRRQLAVLLLLTLIWGLNWPVMKLGVSGFPPLSFRAVSMLAGLPLFGLALLALRVPLALPREHWGELLRLTVSNMLVWHVVVILAIPSLSSGRAAILGYSMPVFAALWGRWLFGDRLGWRQLAGVAAAGLGVVLLLAHEAGRLAGAPWAAAAMLLAAATWAYGTHRLRRSTIPVPLLAVAFWMTVVTTAVMSVLALAFESHSWTLPSAPVAWAIAYNAVGVFCFAQAAWFYLARTLPPVASSISVMMIPVLGTFSGALVLGETLHWQDFAAMLLIVAAIASVLMRPKAG
ncbi:MULTISPECIES: DMT family transporter [Rubrivivax]|uniref:DMT family transporter n=1 Tax=Rubrivivax benzoatilyticus TaxID=316997 RepID=A0ABX0HYN8_9BURK|nr:MULTISPECIES: DMT family transporter [Rubrivivax]EGJ11897.1 putative amino acid metabolite efflux pump [Rubrivivax benzoatilyticus JA2 = ATCC BAA-35]NHL00102.1 DMT family transporter [Rubrivivax benzoatilyticus]NHL25882.1 DMT family transporter [Rubrivivax benzoatilyticus]